MYCRVFPGWGSGEQESWSRVGGLGLALGQDADTGSSFGWRGRGRAAPRMS